MNVKGDHTWLFELERKEKLLVILSRHRFPCAVAITAIAFMLITYADGTVFELRVSLVKDLVGITIEILGLGAVLFAGLDYLEGTFLEVSGKHKEVAEKISSDAADTPRFQKTPPWEGAAAELRRSSLLQKQTCCFLYHFEADHRYWICLHSSARFNTGNDSPIIVFQVEVYVCLFIFRRKFVVLI